MEQAIITKDQKAVIAAVAAEPLLNDFYLTGGTALAGYYFHHRLSDDLDFFIFNDPDKEFLYAFVERLKILFGAESVRFEHPYDRNIFIFSLARGELKIEFTKYPFLQLEAPVLYDGIRVDALRDIAANKLFTLINRFDPKDFVDMFFLMQQFDMNDIRADVHKKFGIEISDFLLGQELVKVGRIEAMPQMFKELTLEELKAFFTAEAQKLGKNIIQ